jgi:hypothetical protein
VGNLYLQDIGLATRCAKSAYTHAGRLLRCGQIAIDDNGDRGQRSVDFGKFAFGNDKGNTIAGKAKPIASPTRAPLPR